MSNLRTIVTLLLLALVLLAANVVLRFGKSDATPVSRQSLVDPQAEVIAVRFERNGDRPFELHKADSWEIVQPYRSVANSQAVLKLLDSLMTARIVDTASDSELVRIGRSPEDFSLDRPRVRVTLTMTSGVTETLSFGSVSPAGDAVYASVAGDSSIYLIPLETMEVVDVQVDSLRFKFLMNFDIKSVVSVDLRDGSGTAYSFVHDADGWTSSSGKASAEKVEEFLGKLLTAEARTFVWPLGATNESEVASSSLLSGYGLDPESAVVVSLKDANGSSCQLSFGKEGENGIYAFAQNSTAIVTVPVELRDMVIGCHARFVDSRLFRMELASINTFALLDGDVNCIFSKGTDGKWNLESPISAPADSAFVGNVLDRVLRLTSADLAKSGVKISIGTDIAPVVVGRERVLGSDSISLARSLQVLAIPSEQVKRIVRTSATADGVAQSSVLFDAVRRDWNIEGEQVGGVVDSDGVSKVLSSIKSLMARRVVAIKATAADLPVYGLDRPYLNLAIDRDVTDAVRRNIIVGAKTKNGRYLTIGAADAIFEVSDEVVRALSVPIVNNK